MNYIKVKELSKSYSDINALKNLSMEIEAGTLFGILGPNGAGKSTLIKILATLIEPDSGEVFINNINLVKNSRKIRELIGYVAQDIALDKILTGRELLDFQADLYHINKNKKFERINGEIISASINPLSLGNPSIHLGQVIGLRLISRISEVQKNNTCVILGCESVECMRLEAGGMANMELIEQVVPNSFSTSEYDVSKLLGSSRGNTSPLFENSIKIALQIFNGFNNS